MVKPWQRETKPPRRTAPEALAKYRPAEARQLGETLAAYRAFLAFLSHGSIRKAADALGTNRSVIERWSKRWRWPERKALILQRAAKRYRDLLEYEEKHDLPAARDRFELQDREMQTFLKITSPKHEVEMRKQLAEITKNVKDFDALLG